MLADLHIHTRFSDGSYTIKDALKKAGLRGIDVVSFTDHDTVDQTIPALKESRIAGVKVIPGIEMSGYDFKRKRKIHILGYGYAPEASAIKTLCFPLLKKRHNNTLNQIDILNKAGYAVTEKEVYNVAGKNTSCLYKQHIMQLLILKKQTTSIYGALYHKLFKHSGICSMDIEYGDARDAVIAILNDGGLPVLAHPGQTDSWEIIPELVDIGLAGIELYHQDHCKNDYSKILGAAKKYNLFTTGGSDDHGIFGSSHKMGDIRAPFGSIKEMRRKLHII